MHVRAHQKVSTSRLTLNFLNFFIGNMAFHFIICIVHNCIVPGQFVLHTYETKIPIKIETRNCID